MARVLPAGKKAIREAVEIVKKGGLVIYPTDTVYGVGCDPFNVGAVDRIIRAKGRENRPLPVLAYSLRHAERIAIFNDLARDLASRFWPGPLTMVLKRREILPNEVTANQDTVGVRVPSSEITSLLTKQVGGLLIGTSANKSGERPPLTALEAQEQLSDLVDLIIDGGPTRIGKPSTVVDVTGKVARVLRKGPITIR